ncbi:hypothetical protein U1Q18_039807 [Sarracenia purpurea var. burkii]
MEKNAFVLQGAHLQCLGTQAFPEDDYHFSKGTPDWSIVVTGATKLVEEADFKSTRDLFGGRGDEKNLENFIPKSESDFLEYAELISHKLRPYEAVMRLSMTSLKAADAKEVASSVTAIANEKIKAEKEANAGKKNTGNFVSLFMLKRSIYA